MDEGHIEPGAGPRFYGLHEWDSPEADLIDARAVAFFKQALGQE